MFKSVFYAHCVHLSVSMVESVVPGPMLTWILTPVSRGNDYEAVSSRPM